jgi:hypothetical protein
MLKMPLSLGNYPYSIPLYYGECGNEHKSLPLLPTDHYHPIYSHLFNNRIVIALSEGHEY